MKHAVRLLRCCFVSLTYSTRVETEMLHSRVLSDRVTFIRLFRILSTSSLEGPKARNDFINQLSGLSISLEVDLRLRRPRALLPRSSHPDMRRCLAAEIFEHKFTLKGPSFFRSADTRRKIHCLGRSTRLEFPFGNISVWSSKPSIMHSPAGSKFYILRTTIRDEEVVSVKLRELALHLFENLRELRATLVGLVWIILDIPETPVWTTHGPHVFRVAAHVRIRSIAYAIVGEWQSLDWEAGIIEPMTGLTNVHVTPSEKLPFVIYESSRRDVHLGAQRLVVFAV